MVHKHVRVAVIGYGAIGRRVVDGIRNGEAPGATLAGVIVRTKGAAAADGVREFDLETALGEADLVVESAGGDAVRAIGSRVIEAGKDLLIVSIGALVDEDLRANLLGGPGRLHLSTGGIGGLDLLRAASLGTPGITRANLTTSKLPGTLVQPWMSDDQASELRAATEAVTVFDGTVRDAIVKFPNSLNVAVALAAATNLWDEATVRLVADPEATLTNHLIEAEGPAGRYEFNITNHPLPANPASSSVVPQSLLSGVARLANPSGSFI